MTEYENLKNICGIYKITNTITNNFYIGSTVNFYNRFKKHRHSLNNNKHENIHLQRAFNKYGEDFFEFKIIFFFFSRLNK